MSNDAPPKTKYVLECVGLLVTITAGLVGTYMTLNASSSAPAPATATTESPAVVADASRRAPQRAVAATQARMATRSNAPRPAIPAPTVAAVDVSRLKGFAEVRRVQRENLDQLKQLLDAYPQSVMQVAAQPIGYQPEQKSCVVEATVRLDQGRYAAFLNAMTPLLDLDSQLVDRLQPAPDNGPGLAASAKLRLTLEKERGGPYFAFGETASKAARDVLAAVVEKKRRRGQPITPEVMVAVSPPAGGYGTPGADLSAQLWRVTPDVGKAFAAMLARAEELKLAIALQDAAGAELGSRTRPLATPFEGTWNPNRFVQPASLLGDSWSLEKGRLAPQASLKSAHKDDSEGHQVIGCLPGFVSSAVRIDGETKNDGADLVGTVKYRLLAPIAEEAVERIATASAVLVE